MAERVETGIYVRTVPEREPLTPEKLQSVLPDVHRGWAFHEQLSDWLDEVETLTCESLRQRMVKHNHRQWLDIGDGAQLYAIPEDLTLVETETARDGRELLDEIRGLRVQLNKCGDLAFALLAAMRVGRLYERMLVRPFEVFADIGKKVKHANPRGRPKQSRKEVEQYVAEIDCKLAEAKQTGRNSKTQLLTRWEAKDKYYAAKRRLKESEKK